MEPLQYALVQGASSVVAPATFGSSYRPLRPGRQRGCRRGRRVHAGCKCGQPPLTPRGSGEQTLCGTGRFAIVQLPVTAVPPPAPPDAPGRGGGNPRWVRRRGGEVGAGLFGVLVGILGQGMSVCRQGCTSGSRGDLRRARVDGVGGARVARVGTERAPTVCRPGAKCVRCLRQHSA